MPVLRIHPYPSLALAVLAMLTASLATQPVHARLLESQIDVPIEVVDAYGKRIAQPIRVTVWSDDANPTPAPVMVLGHGRAAEADKRAGLGRARLSAASAFFVRRGFIVAVPTRVGYGVSGGEDIENSGPCQNKRYASGYAAAAQQTLQVLQVVRQRPDAAKDRAVVVGQSYGGATAIAVGALQPPGVQAVINFAGGGGGNPVTQPGRPCAPQQLEQMFARYGATLRIPSLWVYTENDLYMGATHPREWFAAFRAAGGTGEFIQFPPHGEDGHLVFSRAPQLWQPRVADFLDGNGFPAPVSAARTPAAQLQPEKPAPAQDNGEY